MMSFETRKTRGEHGMNKRIPVAAVLVLLATAGNLLAGDYIQLFSGKHRGEPASDTALVYFVRPASIGKGERIWVFADQFGLGGTKGNSYTYPQVPPGRRMIWAKAQNIDALEIDFEPGKTYYIKQAIKSGGLNAWVTLTVLSQQEWEQEMENCKKYTRLTVRGESRIAAIGRENYEKALGKLQEEQPSE
jgi:hypothetical protein